ncbi:hypothetical protein KKE60_06780 [Patescibacteria group bacterium]|nr:hypothetical protein [Patescibacteria group bacterium]
MAVGAALEYGILVGGYDLSAKHKMVKLGLSKDTPEKTQFTETTKTRASGLHDAEFAGEGYWEAGTTGEPDTVLYPLVGTSNTLITLCAPSNAVGNIAYSAQAGLFQYSPGANIGEVFGYSWSGYVDTARVVRGIILGTGAKTSTGNGAATLIGALGANQELYAILHVTAVSGTDTPTITVKIQSDDAVGFAAPTDRVTFTAKTAIGTQWATKIDGDVSPITDTYWRAQWTVSGTNPSLTILSSLAINNKI